jgi:hypothetical protein
MIDGITGTLITASEQQLTFGVTLVETDFDSSMFLPGVSLTAQDLLDHGALIFS